MGVPGGGRGWVRIIAGEYRGLRIGTLPGRDVRPTSDRVRESLFGILGERVVGARVLDCFAGTGALGIEALSRGATHAAFVEADPRALQLLRSNLERLDLSRLGTVIPGDALHPETWQERGFPASIVFADPPYRRSMAFGFLDALASRGRSQPGCLVVVEHERELDLAHLAFTAVDHRRYGDTAITFLTSPEKENAA
jgi:16S rRNA (guanine966-N2)-methyltransferase